MQEEFEEKKNQTWAKEEVRVRKKREIKVRGGREKKEAFFKPGRKTLPQSGASQRKKGRMPLYNLECLYSNRRSELCGPKNAAISALSHPPLLG